MHIIHLGTLLDEQAQRNKKERITKMNWIMNSKCSPPSFMSKNIHSPAQYFPLLSMLYILAASFDAEGSQSGHESKIWGSR